jgi:flagellar secretion chaperone FliS
MFMGYGRQAAQYREVEVGSASPGQLVVMVYDHLLRSLHRARVATTGGEIETCGDHLEKARNALGELIVTLDHERGGEIARNLAGLYGFFMGELLEVGLRPSVERLDRVIGMITQLRESFAAIATTAPAQVAVGV